MGADLAGARTVGLSSLPLLRVTTALTSSILPFAPLVEPISCIPFCDWDGIFFFSESCSYWLDNLEISECILSSFLLSELLTDSIF